MAPILRSSQPVSEVPSTSETSRVTGSLSKAEVNQKARGSREASIVLDGEANAARALIQLSWHKQIVRRPLIYSYESLFGEPYIISHVDVELPAPMDGIEKTKERADAESTDDETENLPLQIDTVDDFIDDGTFWPLDQPINGEEFLFISQLGYERIERMAYETPIELNLDEFDDDATEDEADRLKRRRSTTKCQLYKPVCRQQECKPSCDQGPSCKINRRANQQSLENLARSADKFVNWARLAKLDALKNAELRHAQRMWTFAKWYAKRLAQWFESSGVGPDQHRIPVEFSMERSVHPEFGTVIDQNMKDFCRGPPEKGKLVGPLLKRAPPEGFDSYEQEAEHQKKLKEAGAARQLGRKKPSSKQKAPLQYPTTGKRRVMKPAPRRRR